MTARRSKSLWYLAMIAYFTVGYMTINALSQGRTHFWDVSLPFESQIPFLPIFIFGYVLVYGTVVAVYFVLDEGAEWRRAVVTFFLATTLAYGFFLLLPVRMELRPDLTELTGFNVLATQLYYRIDLPYNCFPSLHVTYPTLATLVSWRGHRIWRWIFLAMTAIIAVSVVLVKQHYIADVVAGFLNAGLCFWIAKKAVRL